MKLPKMPTSKGRPKVVGKVAAGVLTGFAVGAGVVLAGRAKALEWGQHLAAQAGEKLTQMGGQS